jgi:hypothetical protein
MQTSQKVPTKATSGVAHDWVYHDVVHQNILFGYQKGRGKNGPKSMLPNFKGYIQTDGYGVYDKLAATMLDVNLVGCLVHARRYFIHARENDAELAGHALGIFSKIYQLKNKPKGLKERKSRTFALPR